MTTAKVPSAAMGVSTLTVSPLPTTASPTTNGGNALNGNAGLSAGHETINAEAKVKTSLNPSGVSNAVGIGFPSFVPIRNVLCLASTGRIEPAAVRTVLSEIDAAAPKYALTPTLQLTAAIKEEWYPSIICASARKEATS